MTILNKTQGMGRSIIIDFPLKINTQELSRSIVRQLSSIEGITDYNSFRKSFSTSIRAKKLFLTLLKDKSSGFDFFGKYHKYLEFPTQQNKNLFFIYIKSAVDHEIFKDIGNEIEEVFQFRPKHFYCNPPYRTDWLKDSIKKYAYLSPKEFFMKSHYEEIILENLLNGSMHGLSDKILNLFDDELRRFE